MGGQYNWNKLRQLCAGQKNFFEGQGQSQGILKKVIGNSSFLTDLFIVFCILFYRMPTTT